jgi:hypothetical protein
MDFVIGIEGELAIEAKKIFFKKYSLAIFARLMLI